MDRIKRISMSVLELHRSRFGADFADNKKILQQVSIIRSKGLRNEIAGFITKYVRREIEEELAKEERAKKAAKSKQKKAAARKEEAGADGTSMALKTDVGEADAQTGAESEESTEPKDASEMPAEQTDGVEPEIHDNADVGAPDIADAAGSEDAGTTESGDDPARNA